MRTLKLSLSLLGVILFGVITKQFCYKQTDGFALTKISSSLPFHAQWEVAPLAAQQQKEVMEQLDQPFYYLAKGAQSYVFLSADSKTVVKFFRIYHLTPPFWLTALSFPPALMPYKLGKILAKQEELEKDFQSYKIAFEKMKEETGLLYVHLNKTENLNKTIVFHDKLGIAHSVSLDEMHFLVQKRATLVYPTMEHLLAAEDIDSAKQAISALVRLLYERSERGIFDKDPDLNTNFGFLDLTPVQIDIGRFRLQEEEKTREEKRDEVVRITDHFRQWLENRYPPLADYLTGEIGRVACPL